MCSQVIPRPYCTAPGNAFQVFIVEKQMEFIILILYIIQMSDIIHLLWVNFELEHIYKGGTEYEFLKRYMAERDGKAERGAHAHGRQHLVFRLRAGAAGGAADRPADHQQLQAGSDPAALWGHHPPDAERSFLL